MRTLLALVALILVALPAAAAITGHSTVSNCGEAGNWIEITFTSDDPVTLVDARWDFTETNVWLDPDDPSLCGTINEGVDAVTVYLEGPAGQPTQVWGITASGFDSGDRYRFSRDLDYGGGGSPFTFQYYGGTVTAEFSDGSILTGVFDTPYDEPNGARAYLAESGPNLTFMDKPGWYAPVVPRADGGAGWNDVTAPAALIGESAATYFNAACYNDGDAQALPSSMILQLDGATVCSHNLWTIDPGQYNGWTNDGAHTVRGGRHTLVAFCDAGEVIDESDESDNAYGRQWVWEPLTLTPGQSVVRAAPPHTEAGVEYVQDVWWNCDGLRVEPVSERPWNIVWMVPDGPPSVNNSMRLHPQATGPEDGFGYNFASSFDDDPELLDAIIINALRATDPAYDVGVLNFDPTPPYPDYRIGHVGSSPYPFDFGIFPESPYFASRAMSFDWFTAINELGTANLVVVSDPEDGPVHLGWLPPSFEAGSLEDVPEVVSTGTRGWAVLTLDLQAIGHHGAVVWGNPSEHPGSLAARVGLFHSRPDLRPASMSGWYAPIVPRPDDDAALFSCPEPDTLHGNGPWTWLNAACVNGGTDDADTVSFALRLDGETLVGIRNFTSPLPPGHPRTILNLDNPGTDLPWTVRGGRHTLSYRLDYLEELAELLEVNNLSGRQYCWSPQVLPVGGVMTRTDLAPRAGGHDDGEWNVPLYPNCDGFRLQTTDLGDVGQWRAAAVMPSSNARDVDLELHEPLVGTSDGFGPHRRAVSESEAGRSDFALVCYRFAAPTPYDVAVLDAEGGGGQGYTVQDALSGYLGEVQAGELGPFQILGDRLIELHEMWLPAGDLELRVDDMGGGVDWGVSLYRADRSFFDRTETLPGGLADEHGPGESESIEVDLPAEGHYCVAVWKARTADLPVAAPYRLWLGFGATPAPDAVPEATRLLGAAPNPFNPRTVIAFELAGAGPCELVIHDLQGRAVRRLWRGDLPAGRHEAVFDGNDDRGRRLASGVYLVALRADGVRDLQKVMLVK